MAHRSIPGFLANLRSFFVRGLCLWIRLGDQGARLAKAKTQLAEQPLALTRLQMDPELLAQIAREGFAIPNPTALNTGLQWSSTQRRLNLAPLSRTETRRSPRSLPFGQPCQARFLEMVYPILHGTRRISQDAGGLPTTHAVRDQEHAVEAVIVTRFTRAANLILQSKDHGWSVADL